MNKEKAIRIAESIEKQVEEYHSGLFEQGPGKWNPLCGQWLVYGFESYLGFCDAVELEALVERAFRSKQPIKPVVATFLESWSA